MGNTETNPNISSCAFYVEQGTRVDARLVRCDAVTKNKCFQKSNLTVQMIKNTTRILE